MLGVLIETMTRLGAEFFDIFGALAFVFIIGSSMYELNNKKRMPEWTLYTLIAIGIAGFFVDIFNVYSAYIR